MRDRDELILDVLTTIIVGGAIVCLGGLVFWPSVFIPIAIALLFVTTAIALAGPNF